MYRAGIVLGAAADIVFVVALLALTGRVVASWSASPSNVATVLTGAWALGLIVAGAAPALAYGLTRRNAPPARVLLILWLPALLLATLLIAALIVSPPR